MKTTMRVIILFAVILISAPFSLQARDVSLEQVKQNVRNLQKAVMAEQPAVSAKEFKRVLTSDEKFILLDVRSGSEFMAAHIPGALNIDRGRLEWIAPSIIKKTDRRIYVYCQDGKRSGFATERLLEMGYTNTIHIADGFQAWVTNGYQVYNMHGEFLLSPGGYGLKEPVVGNIGK